jgi:hypothetical protein
MEDGGKPIVKLPLPCFPSVMPTEIRRHLTGRLQTMIGGRRYPVVGTITMDQIMVDMGDDPVAVGDDVLIWGDAEGGSIQVLDVAESMGSIPYEMTCGISRRIRRVVVDGDHHDAISRLTGWQVVIGPME